MVTLTIQAAPNGVIDSLLSSANNKEISTEVRAKTYIDIAEYYLPYKIDSAEYYLNLVFSDQTYLDALPKDYQKHYVVKGWIAFSSMNWTEARTNLEVAYNIASKAGNRTSKIDALITLGAVYTQSQDTMGMDFIDYMLAEIDTNDLQEDKQAYIMAYLYRSKILKNQNKKYHALATLDTILNVSFINSFPALKVGVEQNLGGLLGNMNDIKTAEKYIADLMDKSDSKIKTQALELQLVDIYLKTNRLDKAKKYIDKLSDDKSIVEVYGYSLEMKKARYYILKGEELDKADLALDTAYGYVKNKKNAGKVFSVLLDKGLLHIMNGNYRKASSVFEELKNKKAALSESTFKKYKTRFIELELMLGAKSETVVKSFLLFEEYKKIQRNHEKELLDDQASFYEYQMLVDSKMMSERQANLSKKYSDELSFKNKIIYFSIGVIILLLIVIANLLSRKNKLRT